jgi:CTP:molybdopterin cytidylyltransferase MocA
MGRPKQLLPIGNKPAIRHCAETLISSGITDAAVVLSPPAQDIEEAINDLSPNIVFNEDPVSEMADSVRSGLRVLDPSTTGILICLCDHPLVSPETIKTLMSFHREFPDAIIIPAYNGRRGHPTLFPATVMAEVAKGLTLRDLIRRETERVRQVEVADEGVVLDMDTMEDYRRISERAIP